MRKVEEVQALIPFFFNHTPLKRYYDIAKRYQLENDLIQECLLKLCELAKENFSMYDENKAAFSTFLYYQIWGKAVNFLKKEVRKGIKNISGEFHFYHPTGGDNDDNSFPDEPSYTIEEIMVIAESISHLDERKRYILRKRIEGFTLKEIAEELKVTGERVRQLEQIALKRIGVEK